MPSAFPSLSPTESRQFWGKELWIANRFANELDFYRAITGYKRTLFLLPKSATERRQQAEYGILQSYYFAQKYPEAIDAYTKSHLDQMTFPASDDLLTILFESYQRTQNNDKSSQMLTLISTKSPEKASALTLYQNIYEANLMALSDYAKTETENRPVSEFLYTYYTQSKSVQKAKLLNAFLPGAGYYYVGQKQTALTSFVLNALFISAAYHFFSHKNIAAGVIVSSLEAGWYLGGINGAGLAAKEFNERLYETHAKELLFQQRLFPVLMLKYAF